MSLRAKLSVSYIAIALSSILLVSVLVNVFLEGQFRRYVKTNIDHQNRQLVAQLSQQYNWNGNWNSFNITDIGMTALEQGLIIKLKDAAGRVVWDATQHNNGLCQQMMLHMAKNMSGRYPNWKGGYTVTQYPVMKGSQTIGSVEIGYYGPFYFKDTDLAFINTLNRSLVGVTIFGIMLSLGIANLIARRVSTPIAQVTSTAQQIAGGKLEARSRVQTDIREINELTRAINDLGENLHQQETLRKRLTADVAHELRTPLATVQSHLEAMIDGIWQLDVARLQSCHEEIVRLGRMVKDLEKLAKYEAENLSLYKTEFDLAEMIRQTVLNFEPEVYRKGIAIHFEGETQRPVLADRDKIRQVVVNLLGNSLKYTPTGGEIRISIVTSPETVAIKVADNGTGIAPEDLPHIFERFYRADKSRNRLTGGSGIGLSICKAIVEAHQGAITVRSELGEGTEFTVALPDETGK